MPPPSSTPTEDPPLEDRPGRRRDTTDFTTPERPDPDAPVSFVPHIAVGSTARLHPLRIRTGRFGDLDEHELVKLLDTLEDERARARFRESVYISIFIWAAIALMALFGPKYLWHAPRVVLPSEVLRARELSTLTAPQLTAPRLRAAPPAVDTKTLNHLRSTEPKVTPPPAPARTPEPAPRPAETRPLPNTPAPRLQPSPAPPNLPSTPTPQPVPQPAPARTPPPVVAEAPRPQPSTKPDFNNVPQSASDSMQQAIHGATRGAPSGGGSVSRSSRGGADLGMGGAEILSDTQGVNFQPYLRRILQEIYTQWIPLIPEEARPPLRKSGVTMIRFTILPDGTIGGMYLDGSTHDDALNKAAWGSITGVGQFPALPSQFHGPNLELRIHYLVNQQNE